MDTFMLTIQNLEKAIKFAKEEYKARLGCDSSTNNPVWHTLRTNTNDNKKSLAITPIPELTDELNTFYYRFERSPHTHTGGPVPPHTHTHTDSPVSLPSPFPPSGMWIGVSPD